MANDHTSFSCCYNASGLFKGCYMVPKIFFQMSLKVKLRLYPTIFSWERIASTLHTLKYFYATYVIGLFLLGESLAKWEVTIFSQESVLIEMGSTITGNGLKCMVLIVFIFN